MKVIRLLLMSLLLMLAAPVFAQDDPSPYDVALQRIEEARVSSAAHLDLSSLGLTELPPELWQLSSLQYLWLNSNQLSELPPEIGNLNNLESLILSENQLSGLPSEIANLSNLLFLYLETNQLSELPPEIGQLTQLQYIDLGFNQLETLPSEIGQLSQLQYLYLGFNRLKTLPPEIGRLTSLCFLNIYSNNLHYLPTTLGNLTLLGQSKMCPDDSTLNVRENRLLFPPPEIVERGTPAILAFLRDEHEKRQAEIKRLIVMSASSAGLIAAIMLGFRLRQQGRKSKKKRDE